MDRYAPGALGMDGEAVGAAMRLARRRVELSQRGLADALGWSRARVGRWESGTVPHGFDEVVSVLRVLGFELVLRDPTAARWAEWDEPAEHVLDRADRRLPAHLELCEEHVMATWNWTRHRNEPSPHASRTSFRRRGPCEQRRWRGWARARRDPSSGPEPQPEPRPPGPRGEPEPNPRSPGLEHQNESRPRPTDPDAS